MAVSGVNEGEIRAVLQAGECFWDPENQAVAFVSQPFYLSGLRNLLVGQNPLTGRITTVIRSNKNLIKRVHIRCIDAGFVREHPA